MQATRGHKKPRGLAAKNPGVWDPGLDQDCGRTFCAVLREQRQTGLGKCARQTGQDGQVTVRSTSTAAVDLSYQDCYMLSVVLRRGPLKSYQAYHMFPTIVRSRASTAPPSVSWYTTIPTAMRAVATVLARVRTGRSVRRDSGRQREIQTMVAAAIWIQRPKSMSRRAAYGDWTPCWHRSPSACR